MLSTALPDGRTIAYVYDPLGRRIAKKINGVILEKYLWSGLTQLLAVYDGSDNLVMRFEYADGRVPNVMTKGGQTYYLTYDQVGSLRAVANSTGSVVKRIDYDSFGNIIADSAPTFVVPFGFAGGLHDRDVDLVHFGFRDYDPATGRWTAKDPIGFAGGDVDLYGYVESDPINFVDPYGLYWLKDLSDFSSGFGDYITFGGTGWLREQWGYNNVVDPCSGWYAGGGYTAIGAELALGGASIAQAMSKKALKEAARAEAKDLAEQLVMQDAKNGGGAILNMKLKDPRYVKDWVKKQVNHKRPDGKNITVHYMENVKTGGREGFKFKNTYPY